MTPHQVISWSSTFNFITLKKEGCQQRTILLFHEAVKECRRLIGATNPCNADIGSIRGDFGQSTMNIIHGADSVQSSAREIALWFSDEDLAQWEPALQKWIVDPALIQ